MTDAASPPPGGGLAERMRQAPALSALGVIGIIFLALVVSHGLHDVAQTSLNGLVLGSVYALGAVGLTLVYGILKLTNFAHGDFLTFGAYMAFLVNVTWGGPLVLGIVFGMLATALLAVFLEKIMWGPMRARGAGLLQLLLMSIGLAFLLRYTIQFIWGTEVRALDVNVTEHGAVPRPAHRAHRPDRDRGRLRHAHGGRV